MIEESEFDEATVLANEVIDFVDGENTKMIGLALLMAASTYFVHAGVEIGDSARLLRILMKVKQEEMNDGTAH